MKYPIRTVILLILASSFLGSFSACSEEEDCSLATRAMLNCNIFTIDEVTGAVVKDTLDMLSVTALGTDSVIINRQEQVKDLILPLRYTEETTTLIFRYDDTLSDTLVISHSNTPYFLSMDCGYQMKQELKSIAYSRHLLDSIYISNAEVGIYGTENIKLFY